MGEEDTGAEVGREDTGACVGEDDTGEVVGGNVSGGRIIKACPSGSVGSISIISGSNSSGSLFWTTGPFTDIGTNHQLRRPAWKDRQPFGLDRRRRTTGPYHPYLCH